MSLHERTLTLSFYQSIIILSLSTHNLTIFFYQPLISIVLLDVTSPSRFMNKSYFYRFTNNSHISVYMTRAEPRACVNIKYNHVNSKVTYLVSLSCCHEYILNESSIMSLEIQVNLCDPMTSVSSLNPIKLFL